MADNYNRQLHYKETLKLEELQKADPQNAARLAAAACAMTHCSASVPDDDPNRQRFVELEKTGAQYSAELATLRASGAFEEYSRWDAANDTLLREDPILSKGNSVGRAVAGAAGAASGFGLAVVSTPACITGVGCALPVLAGVGGAASFLDGVQATRDYFAPYEYTQGQRVADSFSSQTYPGDVNPIKDYGTTAAKYALQVALIKGAGKLAAGPGSSVLVEGVPGGGAKGAGILANAERGTLTEANFAQNKIKSDRSFSEDGQKVYSEMAGTPIKTVEDLASALRAGTIKPNQLPVDYVDMNGTRLILNTRTSTALEQAAIPRSEWFGRNQTGVEAYQGKTFNDLAADQLKNNKLPPTGAEQLKSVRP